PGREHRRAGRRPRARRAGQPPADDRQLRRHGNRAAEHQSAVAVPSAALRQHLPLIRPPPMTHGKPSSTRPATPGGETPPADRTASEPKASADPSNAAPAPTAAQRVGAGLRDLKSRVSTARVLVPINNWDFAERVWAG